MLLTTHDAFVTLLQNTPHFPDVVLSNADLTSELPAVSVSRQGRHPHLSITFGDFAGMQPNGQPITFESLADSIDADRKRATEGLKAVRPSQTSSKSRPFTP